MLAAGRLRSKSGVWGPFFSAPNVFVVDEYIYIYIEKHVYLSSVINNYIYIDMFIAHPFQVEVELPFAEMSICFIAPAWIFLCVLFARAFHDLRRFGRFGRALCGFFAGVVRPFAGVFPCLGVCGILRVFALQNEAHTETTRNKYSLECPGGWF